MIAIVDRKESGYDHEWWAGAIDNFFNAINPLDSFASVPDIGVRFGHYEEYELGALQGGIAGAIGGVVISFGFGGGWRGRTVKRKPPDHVHRVLLLRSAHPPP